jgi:hypothetical protein
LLLLRLSRYVPEEVRATVMNFFRVPLNLIVCLVLYNVSLDFSRTPSHGLRSLTHQRALLFRLLQIASLSEFTVFLICTACLLPALFCQVCIARAAIVHRLQFSEQHLCCLALIVVQIQLVALTVESPEMSKKTGQSESELQVLTASH